MKNDVSDKPAHGGRRHPAAIAWEAFRVSRSSLFTDPVDMRSLTCRLNAAFEEGWNAAARAFAEALRTNQLKDVPGRMMRDSDDKTARLITERRARTSDRRRAPRSNRRRPTD
jgi:hypothetical protein